MKPSLDGVIKANWTIRDNQLYIRCFLDNWDKKYVKPRIRPYFFIREKDFLKALKHLPSWIEVEKGEYYTTNWEKCIKLNVRLPSDVPNIRDKLEKIGIPTYESDIKFVRRWFIDDYILPSSRPPVMFFDIEVDSRRGMPRIDKPEQRILSIAVIDYQGREYFLCDRDEHVIISRFLEILDYHVLAVGWNIIGFDIPYLKARCERLGISFDWNSIKFLDLQRQAERFQLLKGFGSEKLGDVAEILDVGRKVEIRGDMGEVLWDWFRNNPKKLYEYNMTDTRLTKGINDVLNVVNTIISISRIARLPLQELITEQGVISMHKVFENMFMIYSLNRDKRIVLPRRSYGSREVKKYKGAIVLQPRFGVLRNVIELDFESLYPNIIISFNVGVETLDPNGRIKTPYVTRFRDDIRSILAEALEELLKERRKYKKLMKQYPKGSREWKKYNAIQMAYKITANAVYGILGDNTSRIYSKELAETVTSIGRWLFTVMNKIANELGLEVVYGDTDSIYFMPRQKVDLKWCIENAERLCEEINKRLKEIAIREFNIPEEFWSIRLKVEDIFDEIYFIETKKKYAFISATSKPEKLLPFHIQLSDGRIATLVGFEAIKRDYFPLYKSVQIQVIKAILEEGDVSKALPRITNLLRIVEENLYTGIYDKLLVWTKRLNKPLEEYKHRAPHVEAGLKLLKMGKFKPGTPIEYVIVDEVNGRLVAEPVVDNRIPKISPRGYKYYFEKIQEMVERLTKQHITTADLDEFF